MLWETGVSLKINYIQNSLTSPLTSVEESVVSRLWKNKRYSDNLGRRRFGSPRHLHIVSLCPRPWPPSSLLRRPASFLTFNAQPRSADCPTSKWEDELNLPTVPKPRLLLSVSPSVPPAQPHLTMTKQSPADLCSDKIDVCAEIPCSKCTEQMQRSKFEKWKGELTVCQTESNQEKNLHSWPSSVKIQRGKYQYQTWILGLVLRQFARGGWYENAYLTSFCPGLCLSHPSTEAHPRLPIWIFQKSEYLDISISEYFKKSEYLDISISEYLKRKTILKRFTIDVKMKWPLFFAQYQNLISTLPSHWSPSGGWKKELCRKLHNLISFPLYL